ncbi:hypothetical protein [Agarilytica rhodophyticola]|uniref:hypothetical protein n=1 Tax=Agarilytica rhodophyticola TaxID=1737490 RepID=UPI000B34A016|nr:hypothetical protein [Agarilytica rhodophyticola]
MFECTSFLSNVKLLGILGNDVPILYGDLVGAEKSCCVMDLEKGTFEKRFSYDYSKCLTNNFAGHLYIHDLEGKSELLVASAHDVKNYPALKPEHRVKSVLGGCILFEEHKQDIRHLISLQEREKIQSFSMSEEYYYLLEHPDSERLFFVNQVGSIVTCVQGASGDILWQVSFPDHITVDSRWTIKQYGDALVFNGHAVLTEPTNVGEIQFKPRGGQEKVRAMMSIDINSGDILWIQAPVFGGDSGNLNACYNLDSSNSNLTILWSHGCHTIDLKTAETVDLTIFDKKIIKQHKIDFSSVYKNYVVGAGKRGDLVIFDRDTKEIVQSDKGKWGQSLMKAPIISNDFLLVCEDDLGVELPYSVSIFSRS